MSAKFTFEQIVTSMTALGIPREQAERQARHECGIPKPAAANFLQVVGEPLEFPVRLALPWTALVSENRRFCARGSRIFMTAEYKVARAKVKVIALKAMRAADGGQFPPLALPVSLLARVWFPDHRIHDAPNFAGATHNALKKIVVADDVWIHRATWERAGVDQDAPRAEIEIRPL